MKDRDIELLGRCFVIAIMCMLVFPMLIILPDEGKRRKLWNWLEKQLW